MPRTQMDEIARAFANQSQGLDLSEESQDNADAENNSDFQEDQEEFFDFEDKREASESSQDEGEEPGDGAKEKEEGGFQEGREETSQETEEDELNIFQLFNIDKADKPDDKTDENALLQLELRQQKDSLDTERNELIKIKQELDARRQEYINALQSIIGEEDIEPPSAALKEEDPFKYEEQLAMYVQQMHARNKAEENLNKAQAEQIEQQKQDYQKFVAEQTNLMNKAIPVLADPSKGPQIKERMARYAVENGVPVSQLKFMTAAEAKILWDGLRFNMAMQAIKSGKGKRRVKNPKFIKPGSSNAGSSRHSTKGKEALERHKKDPSVANLGALFTQKIDLEGGR